MFMTLIVTLAAEIFNEKSGVYVGKRAHHLKIGMLLLLCIEKCSN